MYPITKAIPKEMLPLGRKPILQYIVEELYGSGIKSILMVVSPGKKIISNYFGDGSEYGVSIDYVCQNEMKGLGDAILHGEEWCQNHPFALAFGDTMIESPNRIPLNSLLETFRSYDADGVVLTETVPLNQVHKYGIVEPVAVNSESFQIASIVEKPDRDVAASQYAVAARWILNPDIFAVLRSSRLEANGEIGLTEAVQSQISQGRKYFGVKLNESERRRDIGSWDTYLEAVVDYATADPEYPKHGANI